MTLTCEHITKSFRDPGGSRITVLENISFELKPGSLIKLRGASGSGKSTLMNILSGLIIPDKGSVLADGIRVHDLSESLRDKFRISHIGYIFQTFNLLNQLSVIENVLLPSILGSSRAGTKNEANALAILSSLGLGEHSGKFPYQLSVGQRQRVAIARALFSEPSFIFADEPTASLDRESSLSVKSSILALRDNGAGVIIASHDDVFDDVKADHVISLGACRRA
jgi:ABC-type lipoprotein export system ATPase subunit